MNHAEVSLLWVSHSAALPGSCCSCGLFSPIQQLADEKTCMQFSIRRPKLPSSETHPEENSYRRLDVSAWLHHLNEAGQVEEEYKLRKVRGFPLLSPVRSVSPQGELREFAFLPGARAGHLGGWRLVSDALAGDLAVGLETAQVGADSSSFPPGHVPVSPVLSPALAREVGLDISRGPFQP